MAWYKKTKMGDLPGDISIQSKAWMLEHKGNVVSKAYLKEHVKKANRRLRRKFRQWVDDAMLDLPERFR